MADVSGAARAKGRPRATQCRDCGEADGLGWWIGRMKHPGAAGSRCHPCYLRYTRERSYRNGKVRGPRDEMRKRRLHAVAVSRDRCDLAPCADCGRPARRFPQGYIATLCRPCRATRIAARRSAAMARRWAAERVGDEITWRELGIRDSWVCHICGGKVRQVPGGAKSPLGATVDHLIPIAGGGEHRWHNVALAHRKCNTSRGARGMVQLRLVG